MNHLRYTVVMEMRLLKKIHRKLGIYANITIQQRGYLAARVGP